MAEDMADSVSKQKMLDIAANYSIWPNAPKTAGREMPRNLRPGLNRVGDAVRWCLAGL
jgi:hypothetical protein